jgi:hypothetical protein
MRTLLAAAIAFFWAVAPVRADEAKLSAALDAFERLTLLIDSTGAAAGDVIATGQILRWSQPLRVRVTGRSSSSELSLTVRSLNAAARARAAQLAPPR